MKVIILPLQLAVDVACLLYLTIWLMEFNNMDNAEFKKYIELIMSMCTDYLMGTLSKETFISNIKLMLDKIAQSPP